MTCQGLGISPRLGQHALRLRSHDEDRHNAFRVAKSHACPQKAPDADQNLTGLLGGQFKPVSGRQSGQRQNYPLPARPTHRLAYPRQAERYPHRVDKSLA